ncbi:F-box family protein [Dorcoceras hygrometricum]|uniref:F-box family protein n=1 Tax=Dorcoceras hygrometricum TaxID=472368 RepID=A0A2Z7CGY2_9LAMI|nr:F-box family protein [Dorcoceras hygrometricum]
MSLFDLRDVCIVIGSLATLDVPMVVDLIGIYVLKGPYCTLTMTDWFLQALSVIPRGSWGDVARRFTMIRWGYTTQHKALASKRRPPLSSTPPSAAAASRDRTCSDHLVVEIPFVSNSSALLVQTDEGVLFPVVDRIRRSTAANLEVPVSL